MKWNQWYVVDVSHFSGNPVHRAIVRCISEDPPIVDFASYGDKETKMLKDIPYFKVISEIKEMKSQ